jgi:hypothetical protein
VTSSALIVLMRFVSRSYVNIQVLSEVITDFNRSGSFSVRCKRSEQISFQTSFCTASSNFGTIFGTVFAQAFFMFNPSVKMCQTLSLSKLTSSAIARTPNLQSF